VSRSDPHPHIRRKHDASLADEQLVEQIRQLADQATVRDRPPRHRDDLPRDVLVLDRTAAPPHPALLVRDPPAPALAPPSPSPPSNRVGPCSTTSADESDRRYECHRGVVLVVARATRGGGRRDPTHGRARRALSRRDVLRTYPHATAVSRVTRGRRGVPGTRI